MCIYCVINLARNGVGMGDVAGAFFLETRKSTFYFIKYEFRFWFPII